MAIWMAKVGVVGSAFFASQEYRVALSKDLPVLPAAPASEDEFFTRHSVPQRLLIGGAAQHSIVAWENCLHSVKLTDPQRYERMHKGTPYYFMGVASYLIEDFEKAFFYMDCAVAEDHHIDVTSWRNTPAGYFMRLDDSSPNQFARELTSRTKQAVASALKAVTSLGGAVLSLQQLHDKLLTPAIDGTDELRSAVTALFTFILEYEPRSRQLVFASSHGGSGEPFYLHLFKGSLIFETLLKVSRPGQRLAQGTIGTYLGDANIKTMLGLPNQFQGMGNISFNQVIASVHNAVTNRDPFNERAIRAAWGVRNTTGHSLAWQTRPKPDEYEMLFNHLLGALFHTVDRLF